LPGKDAPGEHDEANASASEPLINTEMASEDITRAAQLKFAATLTAVVAVAEVVGGALTGSLALLSDAGHMFTDVLSLGLTYAAVRLAQRAPSSRRTYGWHRAEVFAALLNALTLLVIAGWIFHEAYHRLQEPPDVKTLPMLIVALVGLTVNWVVLARLGGHSSHDLNIHSAYLHVLGDLLGSVGVVIGAVVMALTGVYLVDPLISVAIALLITAGGIRVLGGVMNILSESVPRHLSLEDVAEAMRSVPGVENVHHLHIWSICSHIIALSAHAVIGHEDEQHRREVRGRLQEMLRARFGITETTIEIEWGAACEDPQILEPLQHEAPGSEADDH